jgi:hypothetical protein
MNRRSLGISWSQIAVALVAITAVLWGFHRNVRTRIPMAIDGVGVGSTLHIPGHQWGTDGKTIVVAVRYGCHYCESSMGFYETLRKTSNASQGNPRVIFIAQEASAFAEKAVPSGTPASQVFGSTVFPDWIRVTPTLLIANREGRVEQGWEGVLSSDQETSLLSNFTTK